MHALLQLLQEEKKVREWIDSLRAGTDHQLITGLTGSARTLLGKQIYEETNQSVLIVTPNLLHAQKVKDDYTRIMGEDRVFLYPADELIAADMAIASPELRAERIETLDYLSMNKKGVYIIPVAAFRKKLTPRTEWEQLTLTLREGEEIEPERLIQTLVNLGYTRQGMVSSPGEFATRGGIVDIYPLQAEHPVRIELFDTEIDSLRQFSAEDQRSMGRLKDIRILPATDYLWSDEKRLVLKERLEIALGESLKIVKNPQTQQQFMDSISREIGLIKDGLLPDGVAKYLPLMTGHTAELLDYVGLDTLVIFDELGRIQETAETLEREETDWFMSLLEEGLIVHKAKPATSLKAVMQSMKQKQIYYSLFARTFGGIPIKSTLSFSCKPMQEFHGQMHLLAGEMERWEQGNFRVIILAEGKERLDKVQEVLEDYDMSSKIIHEDAHITEPGVYLLDGDVNAGFELPLQRLTVITDAELFKSRPKKRTNRQKLSNAERIKSYSDIKPGDWIVHIHHGIGKYIGIETLEMNGTHKDYLHIRYKGDDKLFVPVDQIDLIQKYVGSGEKEPKVHKLGGADWKKTKIKVSRAVEDIADELIKLYAKREAEVGHAFEPDSDLQQSFEAAFPYEETEDQLRTIEEIKRDMEKARPMDRLVCGDVGYGKTEVAIRAAFKAVMEGKQVAFLCPTTILAQQHYDTLVERFQDFPIEVGLLSRFRTKKQQTETTTGLKKGLVDVVIGTHRVLSKDVEFHDLGLLIVDEEQRFGVKHKEKVKQLKTSVDVITLTATPIPRTLHMSMIGVRDLSVIETPPKNRFPIQTYVVESNGALIREAIEREMARGGQVFFLYNRVEDITRKVEEIQSLVPSARVAYAHGQMTESELESILISFLQGEYDVLVTTTIIETGIDIPNVNTLFVHDADRMGLSQLYQLRGRVGRSNRVAYAYFMHQRDKVLTDVAEKRLQAIKEFTELGSGFKIAMRDLSIRGAGNLLGSQQHGFIDSVGYDLYTQLLEAAVERKRTGKEKEEVVEIEISVPFDAYLPDTYISDGYQKIQMYKRIKAFDKEEEYHDIYDELQDRFGDVPLEAENLLRIARMKVWGRLSGVESIKEQGGKLIVRFGEKTSQQFDAAVFYEKSMTYGKQVNFGVDHGHFLIKIDVKGGKHHPFDVLEKMMELSPQAIRQAS
ncbi:transcription-repair coupling factor [Chryseomicrobium sp. FSL W7-1435]|uniref:transcription-repair coupling factor n=1 Tax=Chryseomicrobium sp. FSL W7-1435 TaxID=2921704 RepID=UPI00315AAC14